VRYFLAGPENPSHPVRANSKYRLIERGDSAIQVYEYSNAEPSWRWEGSGTASAIRWEPELREFRLNDGQAERLVLIEQFYPGWRGSVDGHSVPLERWNGTFQSVQVPAGSHRVRFEYRPARVMLGAAISMVSLFGFGAWLWSLKRRESTL